MQFPFLRCMNPSRTPDRACTYAQVRSRAARGPPPSTYVLDVATPRAHPPIETKAGRAGRHRPQPVLPHADGDARRSRKRRPTDQACRSYAHAHRRALAAWPGLATREPRCVYLPELKKLRKAHKTDLSTFFHIHSTFLDFQLLGSCTKNLLFV
ncbi:hypothetical protein SETIT_5G088900v2 [Setaria italica]|uniref:Uncharacterized protein n=1 Tax=Setaria italica TaxID=4555 RepID=A0A368R4L4_SETIT|nr:hypothetical protein SETIT_5G088900v2 [Setaria italica]